MAPGNIVFNVNKVTLDIVQKLFSGQMVEGFNVPKDKFCYVPSDETGTVEKSQVILTKKEIYEKPSFLTKV